jgi:hypothetical protein
MLLRGRSTNATYSWPSSSSETCAQVVEDGGNLVDHARDGDDRNVAAQDRSDLRVVARDVGCLRAAVLSGTAGRTSVQPTTTRAATAAKANPR